MKKNIFSLFFILLISTFCPDVHPSFLSQVKTVNNSKLQEYTFPSLSQMSQAFNNKQKIAFKEFKSVITNCIHIFSQQLSLNNWVQIEEQQQLNAEFKPYVQKLVVPENAQVAMWGDLHGDINSLLKTLTYLKSEGYISDEFKIIKPDFFMLFLGDYVDRGKNGVEVIYTLLRLKTANPDQVYMVRGNHEDANINSRYGFFDEVQKKFKSNSEQAQDLISKLYEYLPVALFLGYQHQGHHACDFALCCHGGIEPGFNPKKLLMTQGNIAYSWLGKLNRDQWLKKISQFDTVIQKVYEIIPKQEYESYMPYAPTGRQNIGFMWHDFCVDDGECIIDYTRGRGWRFGKKMTELYMSDTWFENSGYSIAKIFRAHQHNGLMMEMLKKNKGMFSLWNEKVYTFLSSKEIGGEFFPDSFAIITANNKWIVDHKNL